MGWAELPLIIHSDAFARIVGEKPKLHCLDTGFGFTEGPAFVADGNGGYLLFTDQGHDNIHLIPWYGLKPYNQITCHSYGPARVFRHPSNIANGQTVDLEGALLTAETTGRRISRTDSGGKVSPVVDSYQGNPLNSPNDVVVKSDGTIWFTDPAYSQLQFPLTCELPSDVYRFDPKSGDLTVVADDVSMPNGLAFSPDESVLYVGDSGAIQAPATFYEEYPHEVYAYPVEGNGLGKRSPFAVIDAGFPDGIRCDREGNVYVGAVDGVQVFDAGGKLIGKILLPKQVGNLTFGGRENNVLFMCATDAVWAIQLNTEGAVPVRALEGVK